ncbi:MAG: hypothetical protein R2802_00605 [Flavobacteriaceae bacterium]|nr:YceI family protein [Mangrovimonas sp.]
MKTLRYILIAFLLAAFTTKDAAKTSLEVWVEHDSEVSISGTTNVNSFTCCYNINKLKDPIAVSFESNKDVMIFKATALELENECFDCGHKGINKDFNKLLKTEVYPTIKLQLREIQKATSSENTFFAKVDIHIANKVNSYQLPVKVTKNGHYSIVGELDLNLTDFNLEAPKKAFGLIVVHDKIKVSFNLHLKEV